jgi:hypothetical protein
MARRSVDGAGDASREAARDLKALVFLSAFVCLLARLLQFPLSRLLRFPLSRAREGGGKSMRGRGHFDDCASR